MDDDTDDTVFSYNTASVTVDATGFYDFNLSFDILEFGDDPHSSSLLFTGFDGVSVSILNNDGTTYDTNVIDGAYANGSFNFDLNFSAMGLEPAHFDSLTFTFHQVDNYGAPFDGIAINNVQLTGEEYRKIFLEAPTSINEDTGTFAIGLSLFPIPDAPVTVNVSFPGLGTSQSIVYPAAALSFQADISFPDDEITTGPRTKFLFATSAGYINDSSPITIFEDDPMILNLTAPPTLAEGISNSASVSLDFIPASGLSIQLATDRPDLISLPSELFISSGNTARNFSIRAVQNLYADGDVPVTITATLSGADPANAQVVVLDNDFGGESIQVPNTISEGAQNLIGTLVLSGNVRTDTQFTIQADPTSLISAPASVTVLADQSSVSFDFSITDDSESNPPRNGSLTAINPDYGDIAETFSIIDDERTGYSIEVNTFVATGSNVPVTVTAINANGNTVQVYNGDIELLLVGPNGEEENVFGNAITIVDGIYTGFFAFDKTDSGWFLRARDTQGIQYDSFEFEPYQRFQFVAEDFAYDKVGYKIYLSSGTNASAGHLNSVTPFDPDTGTFETPLAVGSLPGRIEATDGGEYLYVAVDGSNSVQRIDLTDFSLDMLIALTDSSPGWAGDPFTTYDLITLPGFPEDIVVSQDHVTSSYRTTPRYINGVVQPSSVRNAWQLVPAGSADQFYAYNSANTAYDVFRLELTPDGYASVDSIQSLITGFSERIEGEGDLIFTMLGKVVDGLNLSLRGTIQFPPTWNPQSHSSPPAAIAPDVSQNRVYYAYGNEIACYDTITLVLLEHITLDGIVGNITKLKRIGDERIAMITDQGEFATLDSPTLVPRGTPVDLRIQITTDANPAQINEAMTYYITVENLGIQPSVNTRANLSLGPYQAIQSAEISDGIVNIDGNLVSYSFGTLGPGSSKAMSLTVEPTELAPLICSASTFGRQPDPNFANNSAHTTVSVGFTSSPNTTELLYLQVQELLWNPSSQRLIVAIPEAADPVLGKRILALDPLTGLIDLDVGLPGDPNHIALSDNGQFLWLAYKTGGGVARVDLSTGLIDRSFTLSSGSTPFNALDIVVLRGTTESIAIGAGWEGVRIYDNGVQRPNTTGTYDGSLVELSSDPATIYAYNREHTGFELFKIALDSNGATTLLEQSDLISGFSLQMKSDGDFIYASTGRAINGESFSVDGTFPLSGNATSVEPERSRKRVYFGQAQTIHGYNSDDYLLTWSKSFSDMLGSNTIQKLERWGEDGFAAALTGGRLAIIRTDYIPPTSGPFNIDLLIDPNSLNTSTPTTMISGNAFSSQGVSSVEIDGVPAMTSDGFANWSATIAGLNVGINPVQIVATSAGPLAPQNSKTVSIIYTLPDDSDFDGLSDTWEQNMFPSMTLQDVSPQDDYDKDLKNNFAEYVFGGDPTTADLSGSVAFDPSTGLFSFLRLTDGSMTYEIQSTSNFVDWAPAGANISYVGSPTPIGSGQYERVYFQLTQTFVEVFVRVMAQ
ncbi:MAG: hypothetical protein AAGD22_12140 [Verrucomicrobiota bacterium]